MRVYIAGAINGTVDAEERFQNVEQILKQEGYEVFNPYSYIKQLGIIDEVNIMFILLTKLISCDAIFMMRGWEYSLGANVEHKLAVFLKANSVFTIIYE